MSCVCLTSAGVDARAVCITGLTSTSCRTTHFFIQLQDFLDSQYSKTIEEIKQSSGMLLHNNQRPPSLGGCVHGIYVATLVDTRRKAANERDISKRTVLDYGVSEKTSIDFTSTVWGGSSLFSCMLSCEGVHAGKLTCPSIAMVCTYLGPIQLNGARV